MKMANDSQQAVLNLSKTVIPALDKLEPLMMDRNLPDGLRLKFAEAVYHLNDFQSAWDNDTDRQYSPHVIKKAQEALDFSNSATCDTFAHLADRQNLELLKTVMETAVQLIKNGDTDEAVHYLESSVLDSNRREAL